MYSWEDMCVFDTHTHSNIDYRDSVIASYKKAKLILFWGVLEELSNEYHTGYE